MIFYVGGTKNIVTVAESDCYKYIRKTDSKRADFIVSTIDFNGNKLTKKVTKKEFDEIMCRSVEYQ